MSDKDNLPPLNPREILAYLNDMGIRNVSGEMLKDFMFDLKKLIKYDMKNKRVEYVTQENHLKSDDFVRGPERLYSCSTFSSRSKSVNQSCSRTPLTSTNEVKYIPPTRSCRMKENNCNKINSVHKVQPQELRRLKSASSATCKSSCSNIRNSNLIRVPIAEKPKKSDPVSLYHYYNSLWDKYKANRPGENSWADLRWSVREKLLGATQNKAPAKMTIISQETLAKRRDGWVEK